MTKLVTPIEATIARPQPLDPTDLAVAAFLARYQGRTLDA